MNNRPTASKTSPSCQQPVKVNKTDMDADTLPSFLSVFLLSVHLLAQSPASCICLIKSHTCKRWGAVTHLVHPLCLLTSGATDSTTQRAECLANKQGAHLDNLCIKNAKAGANRRRRQCWFSPQSICKVRVYQTGRAILSNPVTGRRCY